MWAMVWTRLAAGEVPPDAIVATLGGGPYTLPGDAERLGFLDDGTLLAQVGVEVLALDRSGDGSVLTEPRFVFDTAGHAWPIGSAPLPTGPCTPAEPEQLALAAGGVVRACRRDLWVDDRRVLRDLHFSASVGADPTGRLAAVGEPGRLRIVDTERGKRVADVQVDATPRTVTCRGERCVAGAFGGPWIWDAGLGATELAVPGPEPVVFAALGPDGALAAVTAARVVVTSDLRSTCVLPLPVPVDPSGLAAIAPDGARVVIHPGERSQGLVVVDPGACTFVATGAGPRFTGVASAAGQWALGTPSGVRWADADGRLVGAEIPGSPANELWSGADAVAWSLSYDDRLPPTEVGSLAPGATEPSVVSPTSSQRCPALERVGWTCDVETPWAQMAGDNVGRPELHRMDTEHGTVLEVGVQARAAARGREVYALDLTRSLDGHLSRHTEAWVQQAGVLTRLRNVPPHPEVALSRDGALFVAAGKAGTGFYALPGDGPSATFPEMPGWPVDVELDLAGRWVVVLSTRAAAVYERTASGVEQRRIVELDGPTPIDAACMGDRLAIVRDDGSVQIVDLERLTASR